jgi:enoyl-CoA hydratase
VTIDRPDSLNSVTTPVLAGIADAMGYAATDPRVKVVRLGGSGRGFCSGAGMNAEDVAGGPGNEIIAEANRAVRAITALPRPVVAVVHGPAAGVGVSLALACDLILASEKAFFMPAFTQVGLMPDGGASALIAAAIGRIRAMRMALLAERLSAVDALSWGLVSAVYPADDFEAESRQGGLEVAGRPGGGVREDEGCDQRDHPDRAGFRIGARAPGQSVPARSHDFIEGATAFQQRRTPTFTDR